MRGVDQAPRGLLVPGWRMGPSGRRYTVAVVRDCVAAGDYVGLTVIEAARKAGVTDVTAKAHLEAGYLPGTKPRGNACGPRTERSVAWRQKHLPRSLWAVSGKQLAAVLGISAVTLHKLINTDRGPGSVSQRRRSSAVRQFGEQVRQRQKHPLASIVGVS